MQKIGSGRAINPYDPFLGMATAVTRRAKAYDPPLHSEEALSREEAIRFYTINNARLLSVEDLVGSLEAGKRADCVVLDTDLLTCPAEAIRAHSRVADLSWWQAGLFPGRHGNASARTLKAAMLPAAEFSIRLYRPDDLEPIKRLTVDSFVGVTLEQNIEDALGQLRGHDCAGAKRDTLTRTWRPTQRNLRGGNERPDRGLYYDADRPRGEQGPHVRIGGRPGIPWSRPGAATDRTRIGILPH